MNENWASLELNDSSSRIKCTDRIKMNKGSKLNDSSSRIKWMKTEQG